MSNLDAVARVVGRDLGDLEKSHLEHVSDGVALLNSLIAAGRSLAVPFADQQKILAPALEAVGKLSEVGQGYARAHRELSTYVRKFGLEPSAYGESGSGPSASLVAPVRKAVG